MCGESSVGFVGEVDWAAVIAQAVLLACHQGVRVLSGG